MKNLTQKILFSLVGKIGIVSLMAFCLAMFNSNAQSQTLLVNYDFASAVAGTPCTATPLMTAANVTSIFTTGGTNGGTCNTYQGTTYSSQITFPFVVNKEANLAVNIRNSTAEDVSYFQFQLNNVSAYRDYKLFFNAQIATIDFQYSLDGINFISFAQIPSTILAIYLPPRLIDLSSATVLSGQPTVYFRLVGKKEISSNFTIDNFQVQATAIAKSRKRVRLF